MFRRILVPLDGSLIAEQAIGMAASIARATKAEIDLLMVHEPLLPGVEDPTWTEKEIVAGQDYLRQIGDELASGAQVTAHQTLVHGKPADLIALRAKDCDADLIVMTSHGRTGWSRAWLGSVADAVVRGSNVPVLMLRPAERRRDRRVFDATPRHVLVPLDGSEVAMEILGPAGALARAWKATVNLVRVVAPVPLMTQDMGMPFVYLANIADSEATEALVQSATKELERDADAIRATGVSVGKHSVIVSRFTAQSIVDAARAHGCDMIAMATHGRGRSRLLLGSVAEKVRRATDLPVLLHRPAFARVAQPAMTPDAVEAQLPALAGAGSTL